MINPESATTIPRLPCLVVLSIGADLKSEPSSIFSPLRESREPELAIEFSPSFTTFSGVLALGIDDKIKIFSFNFLTTLSISSCVSSVLSLFNIFLAFSKSIFIADKVEAGALSLLIFSKSSSIFSILVFSFVLSNVCFSATFSVLIALLTIEALLFTNSSFLIGFSSSLSVEALLFGPSVIFSTSTFFSETSPALAIPAPKNILAPITTDAAPTLNFLIE